MSPTWGELGSSQFLAAVTAPPDGLDLVTVLPVCWVWDPMAYAAMLAYDPSLGSGCVTLWTDFYMSGP